jgi:hypothetical protein
MTLSTYVENSSDRSWPISAVQVSIAGCLTGKITNDHDRLEPTQSCRS